VTAVSHASSSSKRTIKETRKENQYKIRKIKEKKRKIKLLVFKRPITVNGLINFYPSLQENLTPSHIAANIPLVSLSFLDTPLQSSNSAVSIPVSKISVSNLLGSHNFKLCLCSSDIQANSAKLVETLNLSNVPSKYHELADVFSKTKAETLPPHYPYDLKINLKEGAQSPVGPIYSLLASEQESLKEFIEENLNMSFI